MARASRYPMPTASTGSPQTYLPLRPCKGNVFWQPGSLGLGRGHRGQAAGYGAPPTGPQKSEKQRREIEIVSSSEADPPCCGAAATPGVA